MNRPDRERDERHRTLSGAIRAVRLLRGWTTHDLAQRMGIDRRAYQRFESASGRLDVDLIFRFVEVTDSDSMAMFLATYLHIPEIASRCADNKAGLILALALARLDKRLGERMRRLDLATLMDVFERAADELAEIQEARDTQAQARLRREPPSSDPQT